MIRSWKVLGFAVSLIALGSPAGCSSAATDDAGSADQADTWDPNTEDPSKILPGASVRLSDVLTADDVGKSFGVEDARVPYPDTYWPFVNDGIDVKWMDGQPSPLEKFMAITNPTQVPDAKNWEHTQHGAAVAG